MSRERRELPEGIGEMSDDAVAYLSEQRGEPITRQAVRQLRDRRGIPPADERARAAWEQRRREDDP